MWFWRLGTPKHFYRFAHRAARPLAAAALAAVAAGAVWGLFVAPPDYQQGDAYRIIFIHVPAAWLSLSVYVFIAAMAAVELVWRAKMARLLACAAAPLGAAFTALTLITGSVWGRPMWGTWWEWDPRLTSELILFFLYAGFIALQGALPDRRLAWRAGAVLLVAGVVNVPIVHFSVVWWNSLHQPASISSFARIANPAVEQAMLLPLLWMAAAFTLFFVAALLHRVQSQIVFEERNSRWLRDALRANLD